MFEVRISIRLTCTEGVFYFRDFLKIFFKLCINLNFFFGLNLNFFIGFDDYGDLSCRLGQIYSVRAFPESRNRANYCERYRYRYRRAADSFHPYRFFMPEVHFLIPHDFGQFVLTLPVFFFLVFFVCLCYAILSFVYLMRFFSGFFFHSEFCAHF